MLEGYYMKILLLSSLLFCSEALLPSQGNANTATKPLTLEVVAGALSHATQKTIGIGLAAASATFFMVERIASLSLDVPEKLLIHNRSLPVVLVAAGSVGSVFGALGAVAIPCSFASRGLKFMSITIGDLSYSKDKW